MKQKTFLLFDVEWILDIYHDSTNEYESLKVLEWLRGFFLVEDLIEMCISQTSTDFIYDIVQPALDDNTLSEELEKQICSLVEKMYFDVQNRIAYAIEKEINSNEKPYEVCTLIGFFGATAVISLDKNDDEQSYPTFGEAYGFRNEMWRNEVRNNPVLETFIPFISDKCEKPGTF